VTSQAMVPAPRASARWPGTWVSRCGTKRAAVATKVKITLPGGPIRPASQSAFCAAAIRAPTATSTATESVSEAVTRETARPVTMPSTTRATVPARRAYGRLWP
jgi:hypothetical protein